MKSVYKGNLVEIFEINPHFYFRQSDLDTKKQCNGAYIVGETSVTVIDVPTMEGAEEIIAEVKQLFNKPIRNIILTHNHGDHARGLPRFRDEAINLYCSHCYVNDMAAIFKGGPANIIGIYSCAELLLEDIPVTLFTFEETAHSRGDMFVLLPDDGYLCTGDTVGTPKYLYFQEADPERWAHNILKLKHCGAEHILPGHGDIYGLDAIDITSAQIRNLLSVAREYLSILPPVVLDGYNLAAVADAASDELPSLDTFVSKLIAEDSPGIRSIVDNAGEKEARREIRMMLRYQLRNRFR